MILLNNLIRDDIMYEIIKYIWSIYMNKENFSLSQ